MDLVGTAVQPLVPDDSTGAHRLAGTMRGGSREIAGEAVLVAVGFTLAISVATALPAAAATSGSESVRGAIVASGVSGDAMQW